MSSENLKRRIVAIEQRTTDKRVIILDIGEPVPANAYTVVFIPPKSKLPE